MPAPAEICSGSPVDLLTAGLEIASASIANFPVNAENVLLFIKSKIRLCLTKYSSTSFFLATFAYFITAALTFAPAVNIANLDFHDIGTLNGYNSTRPSNKSFPFKCIADSFPGTGNDLTPTDFNKSSVADPSPA